MIRETATNLPSEWGELVDVDVLNSGHWAGLFRLDADLFVRTAHACTVVPSLVRFPLIRCLDEERVVVVDSRTEKGRLNAWVLSTTNDLSRPFFAGDGIQDVLADRATIVVTYFDEGVFS